MCNVCRSCELRTKRAEKKSKFKCIQNSEFDLQASYMGFVTIQSAGAHKVAYFLNFPSNVTILSDSESSHQDNFHQDKQTVSRCIYD